MAAGLNPFNPREWASLLSSFLVVSQENQRPLAPSFKDLEQPWVREMTPKPHMARCLPPHLC